MQKYICENKCFLNGRIYKLGEVLVAEKKPRHFVEAGSINKRGVEVAEEPKTFYELQKENDNRIREAVGHLDPDDSLGLGKEDKPKDAKNPRVKTSESFL